MYKLYNIHFFSKLGWCVAKHQFLFTDFFFGCFSVVVGFALMQISNFQSLWVSFLCLLLLHMLAHFSVLHFYLSSITHCCGALNRFIVFSGIHSLLSGKECCVYAVAALGLFGYMYNIYVEYICTGTQKICYTLNLRKLLASVYHLNVIAYFILVILRVYGDFKNLSICNILLQ